MTNLQGKQGSTSTIYSFISFNLLQTRLAFFILFDEIRSNNYRNTLSGESIIRRLLVTVDEPRTVRSIRKFGVRSKYLDLLTFNRTLACVAWRFWLLSMAVLSSRAPVKFRA